MNKFLYTLFAIALLSPLAVLGYQRHCLKQQIEAARHDKAEILRRFTSYEQVYKSVSLAELKLVSAFKAHQSMAVVNTASEVLSMIKVDNGHFAGNWVLEEVDSEQPTAYVAEVEDSTLTIFRKEGGAQVLVQRMVADFHNVVPLTQFTDGVAKPYGDYAGALLADLSLQSGENILPFNDLGFGIFKDNYDVLYLITNSFLECRYRLVRAAGE